MSWVLMVGCVHMDFVLSVPHTLTAAPYIFSPRAATQYHGGSYTTK